MGGRSPVKVVYIGGYSRSGSTLLMQLLGLVPGVAAVGELHDLWRRSVQENQLCGCGDKFHECLFWREVLNRTFGAPAEQLPSRELERQRVHLQGCASVQGLLGIIKLAHPVLQSGKHRNAVESYARIVGNLYGAIRDVSGASVVIDSSKVPQYAWLLASAKDIELHMVHLVRDSRGAAFSWRRVKVRPEIHWRTEHMARHSILRSAIEWETFNRLLARRQDLFASYTLLRYEDVVQRPLAAVHQIGRTVSEDWQLDPSVLTAEQRAGPITHTASGNPLRFKAGPLRIARDDQWLEMMPARQQALVTAATAVSLRRYGYRLWPNAAPTAPGTRPFVSGRPQTSSQVSAREVATRSDSDSPRTPRQLRLLMVSARYPPFVGGTEVHTAEVARRLVDRGHDVTVLTTDLDAASSQWRVQDGVKILTVPARPRHRDWYFAPSIFTELRRGNWDIVHCQGYHTLVAPLAMSSALLSKRPYVVSFHSGGHDSRLRRLGRPVQRTVLRGLLRRADQLIGVSEYEAAYFGRKLGLSPGAVSVISNGISPQFQPHPQTAGQEHRIICSIGRLERYKGHHRLVAALPQLHRLDPSIRLVFLGTGGYQSTLERSVMRLGLGHLVEFRQFASDQRRELAEFLAQMKLVVSLSEYESQGIAVLEALAVGCSVLVNDATAFKKLGAAGLVHLAPPRCSARSLADIVLHCLEEKHGRLEELPSWDATTDALETVYFEVVARTSRMGDTAGLSTPVPSRAWRATAAAKRRGTRLR